MFQFNREQIKCRSCGYVSDKKKWIEFRNGFEVVKIDYKDKEKLKCPKCEQKVKFKVL